MKVTKSAVTKLLDQYPELSCFGWGVYDQRSKSSSEIATKLKKDRDTLTDDHSIAQIQLCCEWLSSVNKIKSINTRRSSGVAQSRVTLLTSRQSFKALLNTIRRYLTNSSSVTLGFRVLNHIQKSHRIADWTASPTLARTVRFRALPESVETDETNWLGH